MTWWSQFFPQWLRRSLFAPVPFSSERLWSSITSALIGVKAQNLGSTQSLSEPVCLFSKTCDITKNYFLNRDSWMCGQWFAVKVDFLCAVLSEQSPNIPVEWLMKCPFKAFTHLVGSWRGFLWLSSIKVFIKVLKLIGFLIFFERKLNVVRFNFNIGNDSKWFYRSYKMHITLFGGR